LQHTNIVPIYSVHQCEPHQLVCMPFFGCCTLADVLRKLFGTTAGPSVVPRSGAALLSTVADRAAETLTDSQLGSHLSTANPSGQRLVPRSALERLQDCSYVEACLWLAAEIAAGLAHAHQLGIVHRDLKPANVLITDDGRPMLLDFNLSADDNDAVREDEVGGTLPYMAPEHLRALVGNGRPDARSDIYSLGVVLFELLTGTRPFMDCQGSVNQVVAKLVDERQQLTRASLRASLEEGNRFVSPAVMSILYRCLAPDPRLRYQSTEELQEDLQRQLNHRTLRYAPEPSVRERISKWARRHPRLASATGVSAAATVLLILSTTAWLARGAHVARLTAQQEWNDFQTKYQTVRLALRQPEVQPTTLEQGVAAAREQFRRYASADPATLSQHAGYRLLNHTQQETLQRELAELAFLLASAEVQLARSTNVAPVREQTLLEARSWNHRASLFGSINWPAIGWQREDLLALLDKDHPRAAQPTAPVELTDATTKDFWAMYTAGVARYDQGHFRDAVTTLRHAVD
ncbi:MAG: serine/threonine protein kinase, partial [Planctomycetales bacterium]|nr:serine/threonine protein kinase [Planctomycetales bacterium]